MISVHLPKLNRAEIGYGVPTWNSVPEASSPHWADQYPGKQHSADPRYAPK